jgi:hypothetical protein
MCLTERTCNACKIDIKIVLNYIKFLMRDFNLNKCVEAYCVFYVYNTIICVLAP